MSRTAQPVVHSLHCTACDASKDSITLELCPACEQAMLRSFPASYFEATQSKSTNALESDAKLVLEALELAA